MALLKKHFVFIFIGLFIFSQQINAIPAKPSPITMTQPDGTELSVQLHGDEFFHYSTTLDGFLIERGKDGFFYYKELNNENKLTLSSVRVTDLQKRDKTENTYLNELEKEMILTTLQEKASQTILQKIKRTAKVAQKSNSFPLEGTPHSLVILVEFPNCPYKIEQPYESFYKMLNQEGYSDFEATGSIRDYFIDSSNGKFQPHFDLYGPIMMPKNYEYYGEDSSTSYVGRNDEFIIDACNVLAEQGVMKFSDYDLDGDGIVDNVYLFFAGYSQAETNITSQLWPHAGKLSDFGYTGQKAIIIDGVQIDSYACANELKGKSGAEMAGIGPFVHEFSHVLGLPDLYVTSTSNAFTPGPWSVLDSGPYNNDGKTPPAYSVYERYSLGWLNPIELRSSQDFELADITNNVGCIIKTENKNEYYLLENRRLKGWDTYLPNHGMLIWHIDYDETIWEANTVNNVADHQRVDLIEADRTKIKTQREGHPFPGSANITEFTDMTNPSMKTWSGTSLNKPITAIREDIETDLIRFKFMGGKLGTPPVAKEAEKVTETSFIANWSEVEEATMYYLDVYYYTTDGKKEYDLAYHNTNVGNVLSYEVKRLNPGTEYYYVVRGAHLYDATASSNEIEIKTVEGTFDFFSPLAIEATEITETSFTANWEAMDEATSYQLNVYEKKITQPVGEEKIDFANGLDLPEGWSTNCVRAYYTNGYFGESAPSLYFNQDGFYLETPIYDEEISVVKFWYRSNNSNDKHWIQINGHTGKVWIEDIYTHTSLNANEGGETLALDEDILKGYHGIQIVYRKEGSSNESLALDDVVIGYGKNFEEKYLTSYKELEVGNNLSYNINSLEEGTNYYYTVTALNGELKSATSNEIKVVTKGGLTGIEITNNVKQVFIENDILYFFSDKEESEEIEIYNSTGWMMLKKDFIQEDHISLKGWAKGIYLVRIANEVYKILL